MNLRRLRYRFYKKRGGPRGIGNNCKEFAPGCIVCQSYRHLRERGRFPTYEEMWLICEDAMRQEALAEERSVSKTGQDEKKES